MDVVPVEIAKLVNQGTKAIKQAVIDDDITVSVAAEAIEKLEENEQKMLAEDAKQKEIKTSDVKKYKKKSQKQKITYQNFAEDTKNVISYLKDMDVELDEDDFKKYKNCISQLEKLLKLK
jgi:flavin-dependent dehydrogenase